MTVKYVRKPIGYVRHRLATQVRRVFFKISLMEQHPEVQTTARYALEWLAAVEASGVSCEVPVYEWNEPRVGWCVAIQAPGVLWQGVPKGGCDE